jgi:multicomponent Na+:H+ antiporter subunit A
MNILVSMLAVLFPLLLAWLAIPVTAVAGAVRARWAPRAGILMAGFTFAATLWGWLAGGGEFLVSWIPTWDVNLAFELDGLAALYALLASGIGLLVLMYSASYLPHHLSEENQPRERGINFYVLLLFFMASMIGLLMSQDLLLLFVFWEFTTIASFLLIGFDSHDEDSRRAALMALLVTGITSLFFLIGALVLHAEYETFSLPVLFRAVRPDALLTGSVSFIVVAALAKSAQVPFHFWLPRAMAAPTPVSAYLHSAAMVAAGVFLLSRIYPLLQISRVMLDILIGMGLLSMLVGGIFALRENVLKRVLAYSTIAQYGYVVFMLGLGTPNAAIGASLYVLAHALMKSGLFLTAGAVTQVTGSDKLSELGGLARSLPWLAAGSGAAAAGLAGLPLTLGFFKDEALIRAALGGETWLAIAAVINAALTLAYTWRFWSGIFLGNIRARAHPVPRTMLVPVLTLGAMVILGGTWQRPFVELANAAASSMWRQVVSIELAYHLDARIENILALSVYLLGAFLVVFHSALRPVLNWVSRGGERAGPESVYFRIARWLERVSAFFYNFELHDLSNRVATLLLPVAVLVLIGLWVTPTEGLYQVRTFQLQDLPLALALLLTALSAFAVTIPKHHLTQVMVMSSVNFSLAGVFAFFGAPNLALVGVLIGVVSTLIFVAVFTLFPEDVFQQQETVAISTLRKGRDLAASFVAAIVTFLVVWGILSNPAFEESVADKYMRLTHAKDVVTAILADWRGLDTMGEVTVLAVILVGVGSFLRLRRTN